MLGAIKNYDFVWLFLSAPGALILLVIKGNGPRLMCINNQPLHSHCTWCHHQRIPCCCTFLSKAVINASSHHSLIDRSGEQCSSRNGPLSVQSHDRSRCPPQRHQPQRTVLRGGRAREARPQAQSPVSQNNKKLLDEFYLELDRRWNMN